MHRNVGSRQRSTLRIALVDVRTMQGMLRGKQKGVTEAISTAICECFILEMSKEPIRFINEQLTDVNENEVYAGWFYEGIDAGLPPMSCHEKELDKECNSRSEWDAPIKE